MVCRVARSFLAVFLLMSVATAAVAQGTFEANTNRPGADITRFPVGANPMDCQKACAAEKRCMSWSYNQRAMMCWLKGKVQPARATPGTISGVVRAAAAPPAPQAQPVDLGTIWNEQEAGWQGVWTRVGRSNSFQAIWTKDNRVVRANLQMIVSGNVVSITRDDTSGPGVGKAGCQYTGTVRGNTIAGDYNCAWSKAAGKWKATISR